MNAWDHSSARERRLQRKKLNGKNEKNWIDKYKDQDTCEGYPHIIGRYLQNEMLKAKRIQTDNK